MLPDDEMIRQRAYEIWEREGRPHGREAEHWRMAAEELAAPPAPTDTQEVPAARVRGPAKLDESTPPSGAAGSLSGGQAGQAGNAPAAPSPDPQGDPLGLAQPTAKAMARKRSSTGRSTKGRARPDSSSPADPDTGVPDRTR